MLKPILSNILKHQLKLLVIFSVFFFFVGLIVHVVMTRNYYDKRIQKLPQSASQNKKQLSDITITSEPTPTLTTMPYKPVVYPTDTPIPLSTNTPQQAVPTAQPNTIPVTVGSSVRLCKAEEANQIGNLNTNTKLLSQQYIDCLADHGIAKSNCLGQCTNEYVEAVKHVDTVDSVNAQYESCRNSCIASVGEVVCAPKKEAYLASQTQLDSLVNQYCE